MRFTEEQILSLSLVLFELTFRGKKLLVKISPMFRANTIGANCEAKSSFSKLSPVMIGTM